MLSQAHWLGTGDLGLSEVGTGSYLHEASHIWASLHLPCLYWSSMDPEQKPAKYFFLGQRSGWCQSNENTTHLSWEDEAAGVQCRQLRGWPQTGSSLAISALQVTYQCSTPSLKVPQRQESLPWA